MFSGEAFGVEIAKEFKAHIAAVIAPMQADIDDLKAQIRILESQKPEKGAAGEKGDKGDRGDTGPAGPLPKDGRDGESIVGPQGERGAMFVSGKGFPNIDAKSGDVYLDVESGELYKFKS